MTIYVNAVPANDVWFDLHVDGDVDPLIFCDRDPKDLKYVGPKFTGKREYRAKLVGLGYVPTVARARETANKLGYRLVEVLARKPFQGKFSKSDGWGPVIFGGSTYQFRGGSTALVSCLSDSGPGIEWISESIGSERGFNDDYRWLVVEKQPSIFRRFWAKVRRGA